MSEDGGGQVPTPTLIRRRLPAVCLVQLVERVKQTSSKEKKSSLFVSHAYYNMATKNQNTLNSSPASVSELDEKASPQDLAAVNDTTQASVEPESHLQSKSELALTHTKSSDAAPVFIEGVKLQLVFLGLSLVAFLMLLDISIVATVSFLGKIKTREENRNMKSASTKERNQQNKMNKPLTTSVS